MTNIENTVQNTQQAFADYFSMVGGKKFKQFYYDWHVDNMVSPFANLVCYFKENFGNQAKEKFHEFTEDFAEYVNDAVVECV